MTSDVVTPSPGTEATTRPPGPLDQPPAGGPVPARGAASAADRVAPLITSLFGDRPPIRFEFWDGSALGAVDGPGTVLVRSPNVIRRLLWSPGELGLARAYLTGELQMEGDIFSVLATLHGAAPADLKVGARFPLLALRAAGRLGVLRPPLPRPAEEALPRGRRHSKARDAEVISHHYDISNEFYRLVLGPSITYSCARYVNETDTLEAAQQAKLDLVCRKLGLPDRPGARLLDVGCGWGSMALHAARHYDAQVVGVTLSRAQAELARQRVTEEGLEGQVEIRVQDYRDLRGEQFDVISSIGMFEHVGAEKMAQYFETLYGLLSDTGRLLNHAISSVGGSRITRRSFIGRYVFPDGELMDVSRVAQGMEHAGFEVRDVESLREHYAKTLRAWVANLQDNWDGAVAEVGVQRARVWLLYMAASANGFEDGGISLHQVLGVKTDPHGQSLMPLTRRGW